jgi:hypothetical protein
MIRVDIQARHRLTRRQHDRQLQLCVPLVHVNGDSYRHESNRTSIRCWRRCSRSPEGGPGRHGPVRAGMTVRDIRAHLRETYQVEVSPDLKSG